MGSDSLIDAPGQRVQVIVIRAANDSGMSLVLTVKSLKVPAILGQDRSAGSSCLRQHLRVCADASASFLNGQHVVAKPT
jgi:hypothetical protein